jgi:hypothetical protein
MKAAVFITSIRRVDARVIVTASNGGHGGPPSVEIEVDALVARDLRLGQPIVLTVDFAVE